MDERDLKEMLNYLKEKWPRTLFDGWFKRYSIGKNFSIYWNGGPLKEEVRKYLCNRDFILHLKPNNFYYEVGAPSKTFIYLERGQALPYFNVGIDDD